MSEAPADWLARLAGQLPGPLAHDLNNILAVLAAGLDLIEHAMPAEPAPRARIARLHRALGRAAALTAALQALTPGATESPMRQMLPLLITAAGSRAPLTADLPAEMPALAADPSGLAATLLALALGQRTAAEPAHLSVRTEAGWLDLTWHGLKALPVAEADAIAAFVAAAGGRVTVSPELPAIALRLPVRGVSAG